MMNDLNDFIFSSKTTFTEKAIKVFHFQYQAHLISAQNPRRDPITGRLEPDTLNMKFVVKDRAGNVSDTAFLNNVVILRD